MIYICYIKYLEKYELLCLLSETISSLSQASPAPPHLKRGSLEKPPSPPSLPLKPSYSQVVKTKISPHDLKKQARDPGKLSPDRSHEASCDPSVLSRSPDQTHDLTRSHDQPWSQDPTHFGHATHPLTGVWKTVGRSTDQGIPQGISHSLSPMTTGTGNMPLPV